jgi:hypothetical protein
LTPGSAENSRRCWRLISMKREQKRRRRQVLARSTP